MMKWYWADIFGMILVLAAYLFAPLFFPLTQTAIIAVFLVARILQWGIGQPVLLTGIFYALGIEAMAGIDRSVLTLSFLGLAAVFMLYQNFFRFKPLAEQFLPLSFIFSALVVAVTAGVLEALFLIFDRILYANPIVWGRIPLLASPAYFIILGALQAGGLFVFWRILMSSGRLNTKS